MNSKKVIFPLAALVVAGGLLIYTAHQTQAFGNGNDRQNMVQKLAEKLGKTEDEVSSAFEQTRDENKAERQQAFSDRLSEAVQNGKLTEEQKQLILAKHTEIQAEHEAEMGQREARRTDLESWAKEHNIDMSFLMGPGMDGDFGPRKGMGKIGR